MAYKRNGRGGKRRRRNGNRNGNGFAFIPRGGYQPPNFSYWDVGDKLRRDVQRLKGLINVEFKAKDIVFNVNVPLTGNTLLLNGTTKGDNLGQRDGTTFRVKSVQCRGVIQRDATGAPHSLWRWILVIDKQPNSAAFGITDVVNTISPLALRNLNNRKRFVILADNTYVLSADDGTSSERVFFEYYSKMDMITVFNGGNTGLIADIETNALFMIFITDDTTANTPSIDLRTRIRFIDN